MRPEDGVSPALFIGLGGTGQKVAACLKRNLMDRGSGRMPPGIRLLVLDTARRFEQPGLDDPGEYLYLGQEIARYVEEAVQGRHPQVNSWFLAQEHDNILARADFIWGQSDASFRQLGRLVLFQELQAPDHSRLYALLTGALGRIRADSDGESVQILLVASLVGTSGAGMVIDMAYLSRRLAQQAGFRSSTLWGYLLLPVRTLARADALPAMRARSYATLRELGRLFSEASSRQPVPFHYHAHGDDLWRGEWSGSLFDFLYLLDGSLPGDLPLEDGLAPCLADILCTLIDQKAGQPIREHRKNLQSELDHRRKDGLLPPDGGTVGAVGAYTIALPIQDLIQSWSLRLALEVLDLLLGFKGGQPVDLPPDANQERPGRRGRDEFPDFLKLSWVPHPRDPQQHIELPPWLSCLTDPPPVRWETAAWLQALELQGEDAFAPCLSDRILTCDRTRGESLAESVARIDRQVREFKETWLGVEGRDGRFQGGRWEQRLDEQIQIQIQRFELALTWYLLTLLNGQGGDARRRKGGKLGYAHDFLSGLADHLDRACQVLRDAQRAQAIQPRQWSSAQDLAWHRFKEMTRLVDGRRPWARRRLARAQKEYLDQEQKRVEMRRKELVDQAGVKLVEQARDHVRRLRDQVASWGRALAWGPESLYRRLQDRQRRLNTERENRQKIAVRWTISDDIFEKDRYQFYIRPDAVGDLLARFDWDLDQDLHLGWRDPAGGPLQPLDPTDEGAFLALCRPVFDGALEVESVLSYLVHYHRDPADLARRLGRQGGVTLSHDAANPWRANYLCIAQPRTPGEQDYLNSWLQHLARLAGQVVDPQGQASRFASPVHTDDPFHCNLIYIEELIPLDAVKEYAQAQDEYWSYHQELQIRDLDRRFLHIFPAEVNASRYEDRLRPRRFLAPEIVAQLEHLDRMRLFLLACLHGLIAREVLRSQKEGETAWILTLPPDRWLLTPEGRRGSFLEALTTFTFKGQDQERPDQYRHPIEYQRLKQTVEERAQQDARRRVEGGTAGQSLPDHRRRLIHTLSGRERERAILAAAQMDWLAEGIDRLRTEAQEWRKELPRPEARQMVDLLELFSLMLQEEMEPLEEEIGRQILIAMGGRRTLSLGGV